MSQALLEVIDRLDGEDDARGVARRFRIACDLADMTIRDVAQAAGCNYHQVEAVSCGKIALPRNARQLAAALGVRAGWLVFGEMPMRERRGR